MDKALRVMSTEELETVQVADVVEIDPEQWVAFAVISGEFRWF